MRKLKLQMQTSIDCFVARSDGEMDWLIFNWDDKLKNCINELTAPVDLIIMGRNLAEGLFRRGQLERKRLKRLMISPAK